ncbi:hypothetical protein D8674_012330 [Pyrus ussuriensis x Pyrus communis]|uniref:Malate synthase TIM barrel domain-containing protein n=1 Tax=Pyrus ussuriensis x Pyrus communis TaxID=2448454 RepID=A0A5N5G6Y4_9ROSA|nr:hypothetical protein D8674_012330 [Pyrus ussuriensis x Pyrus communis]
MAGIERGSIRVTVLIETRPAVFQMNEILYEPRDHSVDSTVEDGITFSAMSKPSRLTPTAYCQTVFWLA